MKTPLYNGDQWLGPDVLNTVPHSSTENNRVYARACRSKRLGPYVLNAEPHSTPVNNRVYAMACGPKWLGPDV